MDAVTGAETRIIIDGQYFLDRFRNPRRRFPHNCFYCSRNIRKSNGTFEEGCHRHLVGRIERNRFRASRFDCLVGQT